MYTIVYFHDELELIPTKWRTGGNESFYPPYCSRSRIENAIRLMENPEPCWKKYTIKFIFGTAATYEGGIQKLEALIKEPEIKTDDEKEGGNQRWIFEDTEEERIAKKRRRTNQDESNSDDDEDFKNYMKKSVEEIFRKLNRLEEKLEVLQETVNSNKNLVSEIELLTNEEDIFPLMSIQNLEDLEEKLEEVTFFKKTVNTLKCVGGHDNYTAVVGVLKRVLSNEVAEQYSLAGAKKKRCFKDLILYKVLLEAVRCHRHDLTDVEYGELVARWLVQAKSTRERAEEHMDNVSQFVKECLPGLSDSVLASVLDCIQELGVDTIEDLKYLDPSKDLEMVLKPIQLRKFKEKIDLTFSTSSNHEKEKLNPAACATEIQSDSGEKEIGCVDESFLSEIPLNKFSREIVKKLQKFERPTPAERKEVVRILVSHVTNFKPTPRKKDLEPVAKLLVNSYPKSFKDCVGDENIGLGHSGILCQMIARAENIRRMTNSGLKRTVRRMTNSGLKRTVATGCNEPKRKKLSYYYGCVNFQPRCFPSNENEETQVEKQNWLKSEFAKETRDLVLVETYMDVTYYSQRVCINAKSPVSEIKNEWPFLMTRNYFFKHLRELMGFCVYKKLDDAIQKKVPEIMTYFKNFEPQRFLSLAAIRDLPDNASYLQYLCKYFEEDEDAILKIYEVEDSILEISELCPSNPFIACIGNPYQMDPVCSVIVENNIIERDIILNDAIAMWFGSFYIFNLHYPKTNCATLEFIQRALLGINPDSIVSKINGNVATRVGVHPKVLKLANKLKDDTSAWQL